MIGTRIAPEKHTAVETAGQKVGLNLQQTVEAALDAFVTNAGITVPGSPSLDEQGWIRKLLDLLRSSDNALALVVKTALDAHARGRRSQRKAS